MSEEKKALEAMLAQAALLNAAEKAGIDATATAMYYNGLLQMKVEPQIALSFTLWYIQTVLGGQETL